MSSKSDFFVTFLVVVCSMVLLAALVFAISGNPWQKPHLRFTVDFSDVTGIRLHSSVFYSGDKVGTVDAIDHLEPAQRIEPALPVRVHVSILKNVPVSAHVKVTLSAVSFLGDKHVALIRMDDEGGLLADGARLTSRSSGSMLEMMAPGADEILAKINDVTESLRKFVAPMGKDDAGSKITGVLNNLQKLSEDLKKLIEGEGKTPGLGAKLHDMADKLQHTASGIADLVNGPEGQADKGLSKHASTVIANLEAFSNELNHTLSGEKGKPGLRDRFTEITNDIHGILAGPKGNAEAGLQKRLDSITGKVNTLMDELNTLVVWGEYVTGTLAGKPNRLIFGNKTNDVPTKEQILEHMRNTKQAYPVRIKEEEARKPNARP
jgi:ABC-type transporter Mla subunit MlaD